MTDIKHGWSKFDVSTDEELGLVFPVRDAKGDNTGETLTLTGLHSDLYKRICTEFFKIQRPKNSTLNETNEAFADYVFPRAILGWTFDDELALKNKQELLFVMPWIKDDMFHWYSAGKVFFKEGSPRSSDQKPETAPDMPKDSSSSGSETLTV